MHRKIIIVDHSQIFLGSANLTTSSLRHHANLVLGLYCPELARYLECPTTPSLSFKIHAQQGEIFLLPDPDHLGYRRLIEAIDLAHQKIHIAMFTLTHPDIARALVQAKKRGVDVAIAIDYYTAMGASKNAVTALEKEGVTVYLSQGRELLHHKWAVIDDNILAMGSANWTKAAFSKNQDFLLFLYDLEKEQLKFLKKIWEIIQCEAIQHNLDMIDLPIRTNS